MRERERERERERDGISGSRPIFTSGAKLSLATDPFLDLIYVFVAFFVHHYEFARSYESLDTL